MKDQAPELFDNQPDIMHHLVTTMSPTILMKNGIPVYDNIDYAILYYAMLCYAMLCYAILYYTTAVLYIQWNFAIICLSIALHCSQ